jgi:hypothetical protein
MAAAPPARPNTWGSFKRSAKRVRGFFSRSEIMAPGKPAESTLEEADLSDAIAGGERKKGRKGAPRLKLTAELQALIKMDRKKGDFRFKKIVVRDGKVTVQVWISKMTETIIDQLKRAGLKISFKASTGKMVIGSIPIEKLEDLARLDCVLLVQPVPIG